MRRLAAKVATRPGSTDVVAASTFHSSACPTPATANRQIFSFGVNTYGVSPEADPCASLMQPRR